MPPHGYFSTPVSLNHPLAQPLHELPIIFIINAYFLSFLLVLSYQDHSPQQTEVQTEGRVCLDLVR